ncbi:MAG TPA: hypothetical protein VN734_12990 [Acidobacteriaceae bacterium]|nr:hypothetical protein [Acidobacteriaceae bacterium]
MDRRVIVPTWPGFSWWWLLGATVLANVLRPSVNYVWAIFFGAYYFQYKLHELYEEQRMSAERITG